MKPLALALLLATSLPTRAQRTDSVTVEARAWNRDKDRKVVYSPWRPYQSMTLSRLPGYRPGPTPA
ncbi:MAG: hypothetical protein WKG07_00765 [Hymenobacter sp.]